MWGLLAVSVYLLIFFHFKHRLLHFMLEENQNTLTGNFKKKTAFSQNSYIQIYRIFTEAKITIHTHTKKKIWCGPHTTFSYPTLQ